MRKIFIGLLMLILMVGLASATTLVVNLDPKNALENKTMKDTSSIVYGFNVSGNATLYDCWLFTTENLTNGIGSWVEKETLGNVANFTNTNFTLRSGVKELAGNVNQYTWDILCNGSTTTANVDNIWGVLGSNDTRNAKGTYNFSVDVTPPTVTINSGVDGTWYNATSGNRVPTAGLTVTDNNSQTCVLKTNIHYNKSTPVWVKAVPNATFITNFTKAKWALPGLKEDYTNNTLFNFSYLNATVQFSENWGNSSGFTWWYECNDTANNVATGSNQTFYVDTVAPTAFDFNISDFSTDKRALLNSTGNQSATDYTPQFGWGEVTEQNFSRWEIQFLVGSISSLVFIGKNITSNTTLVTNMSTLNASQTYIINITAFDLAGNSRRMTTTGYKYITNTTNRVLKSGWNIIGNPGWGFTLSELRNWTGATTVSVWHQNHTFGSHVADGAKGDINVKAGDTVLVYLAADYNFTDMIIDYAQFNNSNRISDLNVSLNATGSVQSNWSLVMNKNWTNGFKTLGNIDGYINNCTSYANCWGDAEGATSLNVSYMSHFNNTASSGRKYVPLVGNWSINNNTQVKFGAALWMYSDHLTNMSIDWNKVK